MWHVREEQAEDAAYIEELVIACFGAGRFAKTAYRLREGTTPVKDLSFVAADDQSQELVGSVRFTNIEIGGSAALLLGPLAVRPELHSKGIGISLMQRGIDEARAQGHEVVILVGDEPYYSKVGFARVPPGRFILPGPVDPQRLLGISLKPGALERLSGEVRRASIDVPVSAHATPLI